jgi:hypothetical protein
MALKPGPPAAVARAPLQPARPRRPTCSSRWLERQQASTLGCSSPSSARALASSWGAAAARAAGASPGSSAALPTMSPNRAGRAASKSCAAALAPPRRSKRGWTASQRRRSSESKACCCGGWTTRGSTTPWPCGRARAGREASARPVAAALGLLPLRAGRHWSGRPTLAAAAPSLPSPCNGGGPHVALMGAPRALGTRRPRGGSPWPSYDGPGASPPCDAGEGGGRQVACAAALHNGAPR